jgi:hypothetical protein
MNKREYSIYDALKTIRKRPGMYAGDIDLNAIKTYLAGYTMAMIDAELEDVSEPEFHSFHEFVRAKYNYFESTAGWANMIKAIVIGLEPENLVWEDYDKDMTFEQQKEALVLFYDLLEEFRGSNA